MKRLFLLFVLFLVSFAAFPRFVGDVNDDGSVTIADVTALVNVILGQTDSPAQGSVDFQAADVNGDGTCLSTTLPTGLPIECRRHGPPM